MALRWLLLYASSWFLDWMEHAGPATVLPSALSALHSLEGPPSYLNPEATRPIASSAYHGRHTAPGMLGISFATLP